MSDGQPVRQELLGYVLGAMEGFQRDQIEEQLRRDPDLRRELALVMESLKPLRKAPRELTPPRGLARRTCRMVAAYAESTAELIASAARRSTRPRALRMSSAAAEPSAVGVWRWADLAACATIAAAVALLVFPAIQVSRIHARIADCQDNLRQTGLTLAEHAYPVAAPSVRGDNLLYADGRVRFVVLGGRNEFGEATASGPGDFPGAIDLTGSTFAPLDSGQPSNLFHPAGAAIPIVPVGLGGR